MDGGRFQGAAAKLRTPAAANPPSAQGVKTPAEGEGESVLDMVIEIEGSCGVRDQGGVGERLTASRRWTSCTSGYCEIMMLRQSAPAVCPRVLHLGNPVAPNPEWSR